MLLQEVVRCRRILHVRQGSCGVAVSIAATWPSATIRECLACTSPHIDDYLPGMGHLPGVVVLRFTESPFPRFRRRDTGTHPHAEEHLSRLSQEGSDLHETRRQSVRRLQHP